MGPCLGGVIRGGFLEEITTMLRNHPGGVVFAREGRMGKPEGTALVKRELGHAVEMSPFHPAGVRYRGAVGT